MFAVTSAMAPAVGSTGRAAPKSWGPAFAVPGIGALSRGGFAPNVQELACPSPGECTATGTYSSASGWSTVFVVDEHDGKWGSAQPVPGLVALSSYGASVTSLSCPAPHECVVAGSTGDAPHTGPPDWGSFVATETGGTWDTAQAVPGLSALDGGAGAWPREVACASPGNCVMVGIYSGGTYTSQGFHETSGGFYADETDGTWGTATPAPGLAALNVGDLGYLNSVACPAIGECVAEGEYLDAAGHSQVVVDDQSGGVWSTAQPLPGMNSLNKGDAFASDVSCPAPGACELGGEFATSSGHDAAFVATETASSWNSARRFAGLPGFGSDIRSIACPAVGTCVAGGSYNPIGKYHSRAFVVTESSGVWSPPRSIPGLNAIDTGKYGVVSAISCGSVGNCAIVGSVVAGSTQLGFLANLRNGSWVTASEVRSVTNAEVDTVSCATADACVAGGSGFPLGAFLVTEDR